MAVKLTVKQIAEGNQALDLVFDALLEGLKTEKLKYQNPKYRAAFSKVREIMNILNESEVTVRG